jgi:pyruvate formate lyase activating enzyme
LALPVPASAERVERLPNGPSPDPRLRVGGLTALSTTDYPDRLSAVVFCQGCPWRCGYCHNPHLLPARGTAELRWPDVITFLERRIGLLDAVVFSGGEPLAQAGLASAMRAVRAMGFAVGLHTGGAYPQRFAALLPLVDWVGFDVKAPFADYVGVTGVDRSGNPARASALLLLASGVAHEFRTTVHPRQHTPQSLATLADHLAKLGVRRYALQEFRASGCADRALLAGEQASFLTTGWCAGIASRFEQFVVRRA